MANAQDALQTALQTLEEFRATVQNMRIAQKLYFKTRSPEILQQAKSFEKTVDRMILELANPADKDEF